MSQNQAAIQNLISAGLLLPLEWVMDQEVTLDIKPFVDVGLLSYYGRRLTSKEVAQVKEILESDL